MKIHLTSLLAGLGLLAGIAQVYGQTPVISSFSPDGLLTCTNLAPGTTATVAWASSLAGPWQTNTTGLTALPVGGSGTIQVSVPISAQAAEPVYFRVLGVATPPAGLVAIPGGAFTMGDTLDGETDALPTNITVSAFYLDQYLVTFSQWQLVYNYATNHGYGFVDAGAGKGPDHPVQSVDWYDCVKWSNARSQQAGLTPVYYTDAAFKQVYTNGEVPGLFVNWAAPGFRLPTEAEWEKAARGGVVGLRFPWGDAINDSLANYNADPTNYTYDVNAYAGYNTNFDIGSKPYTSPVGSFPPNRYGLYDMAGNVFEWCTDWYGAAYGQPSNSNPTGPATGTYRVLRGGAWSNYPFDARNSNRAISLPYFVPSDPISPIIGFRCVRGL